LHGFVWQGLTGKFLNNGFRGFDDARRLERCTLHLDLLWTQRAEPACHFPGAKTSESLRCTRQARRLYAGECAFLGAERTGGERSRAVGKRKIFPPEKTARPRASHRKSLGYRPFAPLRTGASLPPLFSRRTPHPAIFEYETLPGASRDLLARVGKAPARARTLTLGE